MTGKELTIKERASQALGLADLEGNLKKLADESKSITAITNQDGYQQCHAKRMVLKNQRIEIEKAGKAARDDANAFAKAVIAEEKRLVGIIAPEESRLQSMQKEHDDRIDRERQARIEAEQKRVETIQEHITDIRRWLEYCTRYDTTAEAIRVQITDLEELAVTDELFQEFAQQARETKSAVLAQLREAHTAAVHREEERREAAEAQAELEKLRAEQAKRDEEDRKRREAEEAAARKKQEEEAAKQRAELEAQRKQQAEAQAKIDAENKRIADERAAFEREQEAARKREAEAQRKRAAEEKAAAERKRKAEEAARKAEFPGEAAIVEALVDRFAVTTEVVMGWLERIRKAA